MKKTSILFLFLALTACDNGGDVKVLTSSQTGQLQESTDPQTILVRSTTFRDSSVIDIEYYDSLDIEGIQNHINEAAGLDFVTSNRRAWLESDQYEYAHPDGNGNAYQTTYRLVTAPIKTATMEERLTELEVLRSSEEISNATYDDVRRRLAGNRPKRTVEKFSSYATSLLSGGFDRSRVLICTGPVSPAGLPAHALINEIIHEMDRTAVIEARKSLLSSRRILLQNAQKSIVDLIGEFSDDIELYDSIPCVASLLNSDEVRRVSESEIIRHIYIGNEATVGSEGEGSFSAMRAGVQAEQFRGANDIGGVAPTSGSPQSRLSAAVIDGGFADHHLAFRDGSSTSNRVIERWDCVMNPCQSFGDLPGNTTTGEGERHGTQVAGIIAQDLMDSQDFSFPLSADRLNRTGMAGESLLILIRASGGPLERGVARAVASGADAINISQTYSGASCATKPDSGASFTVDRKCRGESDGKKLAIDQAYWDGVFVVKSAGNAGPADTSCTCSITLPGDSEGAFNVGSLASDCNDTDHINVRNAKALFNFNDTSEGGGELGGFSSTIRERSLMGIAAPTNHGRVATCTPNTTCDTSALSEYGCGTFGTSFAAPVVVGAAINYKDMWISGGGSPATWLDDAGNMRAQMLLMGDRLANNGTSKLTTGYSTKYGAGRLKMRHRSSAGMDAPSLSRSGVVNISDGAVFDRFVSAGTTAQPLPEEVDSIKVVATWFETDTVIITPYITMQLAVFQPDCVTPISTTTDGSADTKKHIFKSGLAGGKCLRIRLTGVDMEPGDVRRVHWAYYFEDTARDDPEGPTLSSPMQPLDIELP